MSMALQMGPQVCSASMDTGLKAELILRRSKEGGRCRERWRDGKLADRVAGEACHAASV